MTSITSWVRLEPRARDRELVAGVEARLHDPLWLLGRQLQFGELTGSDRGSAIAVRTRARISRIDGVRGSGDWRELDPERYTLSTAALAPDAGRATARPALARRARAGRQLLRLLAAAGLEDAKETFVSSFPFALDDTEVAALDDADRSFLAALAPRVPDGDAAARALEAPLLEDEGLVPDTLGFDPELRDAVTRVCRAWLDWRASVERTTQGPAWDEGELAYRFAARAGQQVLEGTRRAAGPVQWYDFDATASGQPTAPASTVESVCIPAPVRYRGMPARRYWELEDGAVRWPQINTGPGDVGRLLFIEFGLTFGADWMVVPLEVAVPSVVAVESLVAVDTFGVESAVPEIGEIDGPRGTWRFLETSRLGDPDGSSLLVAPTVEPVTGPARAEVDFVRDEMANLVWAVERTAWGADGRARSIAPSAVERPPPEVRTYRVGAPVGEENHPYRPRVDGEEPALVLAAIPGRPAQPRADLPRIVRAHALSRGTRVVTRAVLSRSVDGTNLLIERREVTVAPPSVAPVALEFDRVEGGR